MDRVAGRVALNMQKMVNERCDVTQNGSSLKAQDLIETIKTPPPHSPKTQKQILYLD
jgi:hypothetical protein